MSYDESDVIENIYNGIERGFSINHIKEILSRWYKKEREYRKVNGWDTKDLDRKIKLLERRQIR